MSCCCYPPTPILYYDDISPQARSCYMLIKVLGIDVDLRPINLTDGEHLDEAYRQINPSGTVPTFIDGKLALYDSHTIMIYICDKYTCSCLPQLCPKQYIKRMQLLNLLFYEGCVLYRRHSHALTDILLQKYPNVDIEYHKSKIFDCYRTLDKLLECQSFLIGNSISIADFSVISTVGALDIMFPINADLWPNLYNWVMRLKSTSWYPYNEDGIQKQKELLATVGEFPFPSTIVFDPNIPMRPSFQLNNQQNPNDVNESGKVNIDENAKQSGELGPMNCLCTQKLFKEIKQMLKLQFKQSENIIDNNQVCNNKGNLKRTSYSETDFNQRPYKCLEYECLFKRKGNVVEANLKKCENTLNANALKNSYETLPANNKANNEICPNDTGNTKFAICDKNTCPLYRNAEKQNVMYPNYSPNTSELKPYRSCICFKSNVQNWNSYSDDVNTFKDTGAQCDPNCCCCAATVDDTNYQDDNIEECQPICACRIDDDCIDDVNECQSGDEISMDNASYCDGWQNGDNTRNQLANDGAICQCRNIETNTDNCCDCQKPSDEGVCYILLKKPNSTNTNNNDNSCCKCCCNESNSINPKASSRSFSDEADCAQKLIKLCLCDAASEANDYEKECLLCMCNLIEKIAFKRNCEDEAPSACCCDVINSSNAASLKQNVCTCGEKTTKEEDVIKEDENTTEAGKAIKKGNVKRSKSLEFPRKFEKPEKKGRPSENQSKTAKDQKAISKGARNSNANSPRPSNDIKAKAENLDDSTNEKIPPGIKFCCCCKSTGACEKTNNNSNAFDNYCELGNHSLNACTCIKKNQNSERETMDDSNTNGNDKLKSPARGSAIKAKNPNQKEDKNKSSAVKNESSIETNTTKSTRSSAANSKNQKPPPLPKNNEPAQQSPTSMNPANNDKNNESATKKCSCDKAFPKRNGPHMTVKTVTKCCCKRNANRSASSKCRLKAGSIERTPQIPSKPCNNELNKKISPNKLSNSITSGQTKSNKNISHVKGSRESSKGLNRESHFDINCSGKDTSTVPVKVNGHTCSKDTNNERQRSSLLSQKVSKSNAKTPECSMTCKCRKCLLKSIFNDTGTVNQSHHPVFGKNGPNLAKHTSSKTSNCLYYRNNTNHTKETNKSLVKKSPHRNGPKPKAINKVNRKLPHKTDKKYPGSTRVLSTGRLTRKPLFPPTPNPSFTSLTSTGNGCKYRNSSQNTSHTSITEKRQVQFNKAAGITKNTSFKSKTSLRNISNEKFQYFPTIRVQRKLRTQGGGQIFKPKNSKFKDTKATSDAKIGRDDNKIASTKSSIVMQTNGNVAGNLESIQSQSEVDSENEDSTSSIVIFTSNERLLPQKSIVENSKYSTAVQKNANNIKPPVQLRQPVKFPKTMKCLMEWNGNNLQDDNKTSLPTKSQQEQEKSEMLVVKSISTQSNSKPLSKLSRAKLYDKNRMAAIMKRKSALLRNNVTPSICNMEKKCYHTRSSQTISNPFYSIPTTAYQGLSGIKTTVQKFPAKHITTATNITLPKQLNKPIIFNSQKFMKTSKRRTIV